MTIDSREKACNVLGISTSASSEEINKAYKKLAMKWHPDKWAGKSEAERKAAEEKFKEIGEAKDYLTNNASGANTETIDEDAIWLAKTKVKNAFDYNNVKPEEVEEDIVKKWETRLKELKTKKELEDFTSEVFYFIEIYARYRDSQKKETNSVDSSTSDNSSYSEGGGW